MDKTVKPQLHQSHFQMLYRCGEKFRRVVLNGEKEPSTTPLVVGTATHTTTARNLTNKIEKGQLLTKEAVQDFTRDDFIFTWQGSAIILSEEESNDGLERTKGKLQDQTIALVTEHHYAIAPYIKPRAVERKWVLQAPNYKFDLAGAIDVDEQFLREGPDESTIQIDQIRDTKTRETNLGQSEVDNSEQYTVYALAKYVLDGKIPDYVWQDNLIKPTATQPAKAFSYKSTRDQNDFGVFYQRFHQAHKIIAAGAFTPANPTDWWCSNKFCGFAADGSCPYFNGKRNRPKTERIVKPKESENERAIKKSASTIAGLTAALGTGEGNNVANGAKPTNVA